MMEWVKSHPYLTGGLALAILILYVIYKNSQSSTSNSTATAIPGQSDAITGLQIQAGVQTGQAQLAYQASIAKLQSDQNVAQLQTAAATTVATQDTAAQLTATLAAIGAQNYQTSAALQLGLAQLGQVTPVVTPTGGTPVITGGNSGGGTTGTPATAPSGNGATGPATTPTPINFTVPAGAFSFTNPQGSFSSQPESFVYTPGESYAAFRASAFPQSCNPMDPTCVANEQAVQAGANAVWAHYNYQGQFDQNYAGSGISSFPAIPTQQTPTHFSPNIFTDPSAYQNLPVAVGA